MVAVEEASAGLQSRPRDLLPCFYKPEQSGAGRGQILADCSLLLQIDGGVCCMNVPRCVARPDTELELATGCHLIRLAIDGLARQPSEQ